MQVKSFQYVSHIYVSLLSPDNASAGTKILKYAVK